MHLNECYCLALCACVRYPAFLSVVDIAGLVKGASEGQVRGDAWEGWVGGGGQVRGAERRQVRGAGRAVGGGRYGRWGRGSGQLCSINNVGVEGQYGHRLGVMQHLEGILLPHTDAAYASPLHRACPCLPSPIPITLQAPVPASPISLQAFA